MTGRLSRRTLLGVAGAGAASAVIGGNAGAAQAAGAEPSAGTAPQLEVDVAVIGAGLTGLSAARKLTEAGRSVHVIEADDRVGGRIWTQTADDGTTPLNWGATFVGPSQHRVLALAEELGVATYRTYDRGYNVQAFNGGLRRYRGTIPQIDVLSLLELQYVMRKLNRWSGSVDPAAPWTAPRAELWDSQTVWSWMQENVRSRTVRKLLDLAVLSLFSVESRDISMLYLLGYIASGGDLNALLGTTGGAQERQLSGGSKLLPEGLAAKLGPGALTLGSPVRKVISDGGKLTVIAEQVTVRARRVLVAVPPPMIPRIAFEPGLSAHKDQLCQRLPMGSVGKAIAIYPEPFWRAAGYSGQATSDQGPVRVTFDLTPAAGNPGVLMGFIDGQDARDWGPLAPAERRRRVLAQYSRWFGPKAADPIEFHDAWWDELPLHRGCPVAVSPPGALIGFPGALSRVEGAIHFASTETATRWTGYMDGAIEAGESAAAAINAAL